MDLELLTQLIEDPAHWPFYVLIAAVVIFVLKLINMIVDALAKRISDTVKHKKGLLSLVKGIAQVIAVSVIIYAANSLYWSRHIDSVLPPPLKKPIATFNATVDITIESTEQKAGRFMGLTSHIAFIKGSNAILVATSDGSQRRPLAPNEYGCHVVFTMDSTDSAVGQPVEFLRDTDFVQIGISSLPSEFNLIRGKVVCVINSDVRFEFALPPQKSIGGKVFLRDTKQIAQALE